MRANSTTFLASPLQDNRTLLFGGVAVLIAIVISVALLTLFQLHTAAEQRSRAITLSLAKSVALTIDGQISTIDATLLAASNEIAHQISTGKPNQKSITQMLAQQIALLRHASILRASNEKGDVIYGSEVFLERPNNADREYFIQLRDDPKAAMVISKPVIARSTHKWSWIFARRINKPDGSFGGVVFAAITIDSIYKMFQNIKPESGHTIALRDANLRLIARYSAENQYFPNDDKGISPMFLNALKANPTEGSYTVDVSSYDDGTRMHSYSRNPQYGFLVNVGVGHSTAFAEWRKQAWIIGGLVIIFIAASLLFSFLINRGWRRHEQDMAEIQDGHESLQNILETTLDGFFRADNQGKILDVNQAYCHMSDYTREELLRMQISDLEAMESEYDTTQRIQQIAKYGHAQFESQHRRKDGSIWQVEVSATYRNIMGGQVFAFMRDISERKFLQHELHHIATTDSLTGLINRRHFMELAQNEHRRAIRLHNSMAIALLDLDHLKQTNDAHGHAAGDRVLQTLTQIVQKNIREIDIFARLGGDEFVLLLPGARSEDAYVVLDRARQALAIHSIDFSGHSIAITISAGIASISSDDDTFEILMSRADQALYQSKSAGRNRVTIDHDLI